MDEIKDWIAICDLKARYCRLLDTKQWNAWRNLFTEDCLFDVAQQNDTPPIRGREAALDMVTSHIRDAITVHHVHSPEVTLNGDRAEVVWAMQDRVIASPLQPSITGHGHYHEQLARVEGSWKIAALKLTRLHIDVHQASAPGAAQ